MKEAIIVLGALVGAVVFFTILGGGNLQIGTSPSGPSFQFGYKGPNQR